MELEDLLNSSSSDDSGTATFPEPPSNRNTHSRFLSFAPSSSWRSLPPLSRLAPPTYSATSPPPVEDITAIANRWSRRKSLDTPSYITPSPLLHPAAGVENDQALPRLFPQAISFPQSGGPWLDDQAHSSPVPSSSPSRLFTSSPAKPTSSPGSCSAPRSTSHTPASSPRKYALPMNVSSTLSTSASPSKPSTRFMRPGEIDIWPAHETALSSSTLTSGSIFTQAPAKVVASSSLVGGLIRARVFPDDLPPSSPPPVMSSPVRSLPASQDSRATLPDGAKDQESAQKADQESSPSAPQLLPHTGTPHVTLVDVSCLPLGSAASYTTTAGHESFSNDHASPNENEDVTMLASPHDDQTGSSPPQLPESHEMAVCETSPLKRKASQVVSPTSTPTQPVPAIEEASSVLVHEVAAQPLVIDQDTMPALPESSAQPPALKRQKTEPLTPNPRRITPTAQRLQNKKLATPFRSPLHPQARVAPSGPGRSVAQPSSPSAKASSSARKFDSSPLRPSSSSLVSGGSSTPSRATAPIAKKERSSRVTSQFKSPFKRSASGTSTAPTPALSSSRLTPAVQALEAKVQLLRRALKIKEVESGGTQKPLDELVVKWRTAGRDIARDVWSVVKDEPKQDAGGWPAERGGGGFNSNWGYDKDDAEGADAQTDGAPRERFEEDEMAKEKVEDDIGTMLRQLRIDPATLGWDNEEGDFVDV